MNNMNLLIVEDDPSAITQYKKEIESYNEERSICHNNDIKIVPEIINTKEKAIQTLGNIKKSFDGAIIDLNLLGVGNEDSSGNDVIREIRNNLRFPVFVITGTPAHLDNDLSEESSLFKLIRRGEVDDYLEQLVSIFNTGITKILNKSGKIEKFITQIFWNHLSSSLDLWIKDSQRDSEEKQKSLLRYTLLHMQEYLDINSSGTLEKYHPAEFLITKPIKPSIFTGDILQTKENDRYLILTPACDIDEKSGKRNAEKIFTLKILRPENIDQEFINRNMSNSKKKKIQPILNNSKPRYHFIPKAGDFDNGVIDFQDKKTFDTNGLLESINRGEISRIATISSPFLKDVIARYSNYYSRQGSPDFNQKEIFDALF